VTRITFALLGLLWLPALNAQVRALAPLFEPSPWTRVNVQLSSPRPGSLQITTAKGSTDPGFHTTRLPVSDWSAWKSFRFEVENPYNEPFSVFVRLSNDPAHPSAGTYTGGTFDGFVIVPGRNHVEISLVDMRSPESHPVDARRIAWLGIFVEPLFLRDGQDLAFTAARSFTLSNPRLDPSPAAMQRQPYGDLLFKQTDPSLVPLRKQAEAALASLERTLAEAKARNLETACAEIYPFVANIAFNTRLVAFWQDRAREQRTSLEFLLDATRQADAELRAVLDGKSPNRPVPPVPPYDRLTMRDGYFRLGDAPVLLYGMLYNRRGPLLRWFADSETDYGTQLVAGGTRQDVERQPIWEAYHKCPDTHRVGWPHADHIIRDSGSWEVVGPVVNVCLESPHSRKAVAEMIEKFETTHANERGRLVQSLGFEYTYVCYCDYTKQLWQDWLRRRHGDIATANRVWHTGYAAFSDVPMPRLENAAANRALWFDWASFNLFRFLEQIRWTRDQIRRSNPSAPLTVGSPYFSFDPAFWTSVDEEELADSGITSVMLQENYHLDTLMPEYLHTLAGAQPLVDFEYHGVIEQILPNFLHGSSAISMWWWNDRKHWTPNEPINEWASSFPQSYTIPLRDIAKSMRDALDVRRLGPEIAALASAPRPVAFLYSKTTMLHPDAAPRYLERLRSYYNAAQSSGQYIGVTTETKILARDLDKRRILAVTGAEYVPAPVVEAIRKWVDAGGTLLTLSGSLRADEYGRPLPPVSSRPLEGIPPLPDLAVTPAVEYRVTTFNGRRLGYLYNNSGRDQTIELAPRFPCGRILDLRAGAALPARRISLPAGETAILEFEPAEAR